MTAYQKPSRILRALCRVGRVADVALLGRIGPSTALFVDTIAYRAASKKNDSTYGLDETQAFRFVCDHLERVNQVLPIANMVNFLSMHMARAVTANIPRLIYLLMASIEVGLPGMGEDLINFLESQPEASDAYKTLFGASFLKSSWLGSYGVDPASVVDREDCTIAEFLYGRSAEVGNLCEPMLGSPLFNRYISVHVLNQAMAMMRAQEKSAGLKASFLPVKVPASVLDINAPSDAPPVYVKLNEAARDFAHLAVYRPESTCAGWFASIVADRRKIADIVSAGMGDIVLGVSEARLEHIQRLTPSEVAAEEKRLADEANKQREASEKLMSSVAPNPFQPPASMPVLTISSDPIRKPMVDPDDDVDDK